MKKIVVLRWSISSGMGWSVSSGNDGQFAPELGGQFDRIFQYKVMEFYCFLFINVLKDRLCHSNKVAKNTIKYLLSLFF
jgi:hypothetical protein